jgi:hypothetical protein
MDSLDKLFWIAAAQAFDLYGAETEMMMMAAAAACDERGDGEGANIFRHIRLTVAELQRSAPFEGGGPTKTPGVLH